MNIATCFKCRGRVTDPLNDAGLLDEALWQLDGDHPAELTSTVVHYHLFPGVYEPVDGGDEVVCPGSPSRAQHLGGPRDQRVYGEYYQSDVTDRMTRAYALVQSFVGRTERQPITPATVVYGYPLSAVPA